MSDLIRNRAAALSGVDDSTFTMSAALREAERIIDTRLQDVDHAAFFAAIDAPAEPADALLEAAKRYKARVTSR